MMMMMMMMMFTMMSHIPWSVGVLGTPLHHANIAEPIMSWFGQQTRVGPRNNVLERVHVCNMMQWSVWPAMRAVAVLTQFKCDVHRHSSYWLATASMNWVARSYRSHSSKFRVCAIIFMPHRICVAYRWGLLLLTFPWSICQSVCLSVGLSGMKLLGTLQKRLDRSSCRLACGVGCGTVTMY